MGSGHAQDLGIAGRYAGALFELATETGTVDAVRADLDAIQSLIANNADFAHVVRSALLGRDAQARAIGAVLQAMNANDLTQRFAGMVASKGRLSSLPTIVRAFNARVATARGEIEAEVTATRALTDAETTELKSVLKSRLGREPRLETRVDPALLGGLVVKVGSRMIDSSLRTKLNALRVAMKG